MAQSWVYHDTGKTMLDDVTRIATEYGADDVLIETRPFTAEENATADAQVVSEQETANKSTIEQNLEQDYLNMQAIKAQANADLRADPSQEIKQIADAVRRLTRMALENYSGID